MSFGSPLAGHSANHNLISYVFCENISSIEFSRSLIHGHRENLTYYQVQFLLDTKHWNQALNLLRVHSRKIPKFDGYVSASNLAVSQDRKRPPQHDILPHNWPFFYNKFNTFKNNFVDADDIRGILECQIDTGGGYLLQSSQKLDGMHVWVHTSLTIWSVNSWMCFPLACACNGPNFCIFSNNHCVQNKKIPSPWFSNIELLVGMFDDHVPKERKYPYLGAW